MLLNLKNKNIFFCVESIFEQLPLSFKVQLYNKVTINSELETIQSIEISPALLATVYKEVSSKPEGISSSINKELKDFIMPQIIEKVGTNDAEAIEAATLIQALDANDYAIRDAKIQSGKERILN